VRFDVRDLLAPLGATQSGPDTVVSGASQDSRAIEPGMLFVPLVADRDGHDFIPAAVAAGSPAYLTARGPVADVAATALEVADTDLALRALGRVARARLTGPVVGITGSVGKTSTKDLCAVAFAAGFRTHASTRSFNNEIGVPLTLVNAPDDTQAAVVEMGARGVGHIAMLCGIASPTVAIVTTVGAAHLETFGDVDGVARAKGELVEAVPSTGLAVLNADDPRVVAMRRRTRAHVLTYGEAGEVRAEDVVLDDELRPSFLARTPWGPAKVRLSVRGLHNVGNALAALAAAVGCGVGLDEAAAALAEARLSPWRMDVQRRDDGLVVINDAYNANPVSMRAALDALAAAPATRRFAALGVMAELGDGTADAHREIAAYAQERGIEVIGVGTAAYGGAVVADVDDAVAALVARGLGAGDAVLVKASRVAGLERAASALLRAG
jgi:UDP-N-acetylmuramoyl-tripeptide--D-alanyl-D-alanine ligase